jgi:hypothetical protein
MAIFVTFATLVALCAFIGCERNQSALTGPSAAAPGGNPREASPAISQDGTAPPPGLVQVSFAGEALQLWPYTEASFNGVPSDPVNLLFVGKADPVRIRAALLRLDGNRTAFGFPDMYPFNARWSDAIGDVHVNYAGSEGWLGSVIQLQLGTYDPGRVHLRLFRTGQAFSGSGVWTVGAAHFEVLIPGTADHEVLSWELARQIVTVDLIRSGLLDQSTPFVPTDPITQTPTFREIRKEVYNGLPEELKAAIGGPPGLVSAPVPIPNDGRATLFHIVAEAPAQPGPTADRFSLTYNQVIPKPVCAEGPYDFVQITGPVELSRSTTVDGSGLYEYHERLAGNLTVTPVDVTASPPAPAGPSYQAVIGDLQQGSIGLGSSFALSEMKRIAPQKGGTQMLMTRLRVGTTGTDAYRAEERCP